MSGILSEYTTEELEVIADADWKDVSVLISTAPDVFDSRRVRPETDMAARIPYTVVQRKKGFGNVDLSADQNGDRRVRIDASNDEVFERRIAGVWEEYDRNLG